MQAVTSAGTSDTRALRTALGAFATGVVVVTAAYDGREHGMTANSFTSVSLAPPVVVVCINNAARMAFILETGMEFGLSILACEQQAISNHFAGKPQAAPVEFEWHRGVPLIAGAAAHFICRVSEARVVGTHTMCLASVELFERFDRQPLVFFGGAYGQVVCS